jgi:hypothetical protein
MQGTLDQHYLCCIGGDHNPMGGGRQCFLPMPQSQVLRHIMNYLPALLFIGLLLAVIYFETQSIIEYAADHYHVSCERSPGKFDCRLKVDL